VWVEFVIEITQDGSGFLLKTSMRLSHPIDEVFRFFADATNLERITPASLSFKVLTEGPIEMAEGTLIDYRLKVHGLPLKWRSEITCWDPPCRFVDEQRKGPYHYWIHEHRFEAEGDTTVVHDRVRYGVPGGRFVNRFFVSRDLRSIFTFRTQALKEHFARQDNTNKLASHE